MRTLQDLKCIGILITPELRVKILSEVEARIDGKHDGVLYEALSDIIINKFTGTDLRKQLSKQKAVKTRPCQGSEA